MRKNRTAAFVVFTALALAPGWCLAAGELAPHQLWVAHLLAGGIAAMVGYAAGRDWPWAGIVLTAAAVYVVTRWQAPSNVPELLAQFGERYPFHVQATALLVPLMVVVGVGARRNAMSLAAAAPNALR